VAVCISGPQCITFLSGCLWVQSTAPVLYKAAIFRYCCVYMFVRLLRLSIFKRLKKYLLFITQHRNNRFEWFTFYGDLQR